MRPRDRSWAREFARDQAESAFTVILRRLLYRTTGLLAVAFVDAEGECVDYCSAIDPYEAKVAGAQLMVTMTELGARMARLGAGTSFMLTMHGTRRDLVVRRVSDEYLLVVLMRPRALTRRLTGGIEHAVTELRREAGIATPPWEPVVDSVRVELREAVGWAYAPQAYFDEGGERVGIGAVLGRWMEGAGADARVCFRVATEAGEELTLVHDRGHDRWERQRQAGG
ncbi:MAG: roadblock/LC7 domain-containing protein [Sandaracinaceae bacterium]|nr:roadblock/LC7 domain-containing protein [Sandaracinaceae bacterium]